MSEDQYTPPGQTGAQEATTSNPQAGSGIAPTPPPAPVQAAPTPPSPPEPAAVEPDDAPSIEDNRAAVKSEMTAEGRYIPYGGGIMGWFENSGVLKCEEHNKYQFHTILNPNQVRQKLFERWGNTDNINRRVVKREAVESAMDIKTTLISGPDTYLATTMDYSAHGLRLQLIQEEVKLTKGQELQVQLFRDVEREELAFDVKAKLMWINRTGRRRPIWQMGLSFDGVDFEVAQEIKSFFSGG